MRTYHGVQVNLEGQLTLIELHKEDLRVEDVGRVECYEEKVAVLGWTTSACQLVIEEPVLVAQRAHLCFVIQFGVHSLLAIGPVHQRDLAFDLAL